MNETTEVLIIDTDALINSRAIGRVQILIGVLGACALFVEGFDTSAIGYIAPAIAKQWAVASGTMGAILTADMVGLLLGYLFLSPFSARFGHKRMVVASTAAFGALTFLTVSSTGIGMLIAFRFLTGIGVGGAMPSAVALTGEYFPERVRSTAITMVYVGYSIGQILAGAIAGVLLPLFGWRAVLGVGGIVTLGFAMLFVALLPESLEYLVNRGSGRNAAMALIARLFPSVELSPFTRRNAGAKGTRIRVWQLFEDRRSLGTLCVWAGMFLNLMVYFFLQKWLTLLLARVGLPQADAIFATEVAFAAGIVAALILGPLMDKFGPYAVVSGLFALSALACLGMGTALSRPDVALMTAMSFAVGFCLSGGQKANNALCVHFYPTALRGTGLGWGLGVGRIGGALGPYLPGVLLSLGWTPNGLFYIAAIPMAAGAVVIALMGQIYGQGARMPALAPARKTS